MSGSRWVVLIAIAGIVVGVAVLAATPTIKDALSERAFRNDMRGLIADAKDVAAEVSSYEERDRFFLWHLDEMRALIGRHEALASEGHARFLKALGAICDDVRSIIEAANNARESTRVLRGLELHQYSDDATYSDAVIRMRENVDYLERRLSTIKSMREKHRLSLADFGLDQAQRTELWQWLMVFYEEINKELLNDGAKAESYRALMRLAEFLHKNKTRYAVDPEGQLLFSDANALMRFRSLALELETGAAPLSRP